MLKPVTKSAFLDLSKASINVRNYQVYASADLMERLGMPDTVVLYLDRDENELGIANGDNIEDDGETIFAKTSIKTKGGGSGRRLINFPPFIKDRLDEIPTFATRSEKVGGRDVIVFSLLPPLED